MPKIVKVILLLLFCSLYTYQSLAQSFQFGKVADTIVQQAINPKYPEANAVILFKGVNNTIKEKERFFILETEITERLKVYNTQGQKLASIDILLQPDEEVKNIKGNTYTFDGTEVQTTAMTKTAQQIIILDNGIKLLKLTLPNVQHGSVIEYTYTKSSPYINQIPEVILQDTIPIKQVYTTFKFPKYFEYFPFHKGYYPYQLSLNGSVVYKDSKLADIEKIKQTRNNNSFQNIYTVGLFNVPAFTSDAYSKDLKRPLTALGFQLNYTLFPEEGIRAILESWDALAKRIYESRDFKNQFLEASYLSDIVNTLVEGEGNNLKDLNTIFTYVRDRMRWNGGYGVYPFEGVKNAFLKTQGNVADINLLLLALLKRTNIPAYPVLVSTKRNGLPKLPNDTAFDYLIVQANINGKSYLLDATSRFHSLGVLPDEAINFRGRLIKDDGSSAWVSLFPEEASVKNVFTNLSIKNGEAYGSTQVRLTRNLELNKLEEFAGNQHKTPEELLQQQKKNISISEVIIEHVEIDKSLQYTYNFLETSCISQTPGTITLNLTPFAEFTENPFKKNTRYHPIDFSFKTLYRSIINIEIPEGYLLQDQDTFKEVVTKENILRYQYKVSEINNQLQVATLLYINYPILDAAYYEDVKSFFTKVLEVQHLPIVFKKI